MAVCRHRAQPEGKFSPEEKIVFWEKFFVKGDLPNRPHLLNH